MTPRQLPDHLLRESLRTRENLRDFLESALPAESPHFDFDQFEELPREAFTGDWREREADLVFEVGYRVPGETLSALVGVMVEHQSNTDVAVPLRAFFTLANFWERRWRLWEQGPTPRPAFRLPPPFCVVLYTADRPWGSNTNVRQLLAEPTTFHHFAPDWGPVFWNLSDRSADTLLAGPPWMQFMSVVRATWADVAEFERVLRSATRRLRPTGDTAHSRWEQLYRMVVSYSLFRRPEAEHARLTEIIEAENEARLEEVQQMSKTIAQAMEERAELRQARTDVGEVLEERFGTVPVAVRQRLDALDDAARLKAALRLAARISNLEDFQP